MNLTLHRIYFKPTYVIGKLYIDNVYFCDTLEDANRDLNKNGHFDYPEKKVPKETCIPFGTYKIILNRSPKLKRILPRLLNVPSFSGILIHSGSTPKNTEGCILIGKNTSTGRLSDSKKYEVELIQKMQDALKMNHEIYITID